MKCMQRPPHIIRTKCKYQREIYCISEIELMSVNAHFLKKDARNVWMKENNISNILCYKVRDYFSL